MNMALKVKFGTGNEARADALEVLAWITRTWDSDLRVLSLGTEDEVEVLRLKGNSLQPMEATLAHIIGNYHPGEGFEAIFVAKVA